MKNVYSGTEHFNRKIITRNTITEHSITRNPITGNAVTQSIHTTNTVNRNKKIFLKQFILFMLLIGIFVIILHSISVAGKSIRSSSRQNPSKYYTSITIQPGDTLWSIAEEYMPEEYTDTKEYVEEIMELNHLHSFKIHSGGSLVIPYY